MCVVFRTFEQRCRSLIEKIECVEVCCMLTCFGEVFYDSCSGCGLICPELRFAAGVAASDT